MMNDQKKEAEHLPMEKNIIAGAECAARAKKQRAAVEALREMPAEEQLWDCIVAFQNAPFYTSSGLPFTYTLKIGRNGAYTKELFIDRRKGSKSLAWSSIRMAFEKVLKAQELPVFFERPKAIGDIRGISYIYPMLWRFGLVAVPDKIYREMCPTPDDAFHDFIGEAHEKEEIP